jgi:hypothetical protein
MLILFNHVTPKGIARALVGHTVTKAKDRRWDTFSNGDLLAAAKAAGFEPGRPPHSSCRPRHAAMDGRKIASVAAAVTAATPGSYTEMKVEPLTTK